MFFGSWDSIARIGLVGTLAYAGLVVLLRISGNRTLSKMNSFDLVVTVAFGSTLSSILIDRKIPLADGIAAIALLVLLQFAVTWISVRSRRFSKFVKTAPTLLAENGRFHHEAMKLTRITEDEIRSALRKHGMGGIEQAAAVVMESDGSLSVIALGESGTASALENVQRLQG